MFQNALPAIGLLVLMMLVAWILQRYKRHLPGRLGQTGTPMQVTGGLSLGPQHRLVSVRIGEGPGQVHMVLGVAPGSITTVTTLPSGDTAGPASPGPGFAEQLAALASPKERA
ncbi:MAG: FliO/MopB family protein [Gammaproteobacteria bacterium]